MSIITKASTTDSRELIIAQLDLYPGPKKAAGSWLMVRCPHPEHNDSNPSCGVVVSGDNLGFYNCLGCGERGGWNRFAELAGLATVQVILADNPVDLTNGLDADLLEDLTLTKCFSGLGVTSALPWPVDVTWRGFPGEYLAAAGAYLGSYSGSEQATSCLVLPCYVLGKLRGAIRASWTKRAGELSYVTLSNSYSRAWVRRYGLLFYDIARKLILNRNLSFVVLVEGPRDALRLLCNGVPAVAVLGASNLNVDKAGLITGLGVSHVYCFPDNDAAGDLMWSKCRKLFTDCNGVRNGVRNVVRVVLPKDGVKLDPANMPKTMLKRFLKRLVAECSFVRLNKVF